MKRRTQHALTFDIEDWFHIIDVKNANDFSLYEKSSIVEAYTTHILDILDKFDTKATFFILGSVAKEFPNIVQEIALRKHELASHSYSHELVYRMNRDQFKKDTLKSIEIIEKISGKKITGYRAPSFSITNNCLWAFEVLYECGIRWDASIFPQKRNHGGLDFVDYPVSLLNTKIQIDIDEFPMRLFRLGDYGICFSGGGYFRILPISLIKFAFNYFDKKNKSCITYLHPRDFCSTLPNLNVSILRKFKTYIGTKSTNNKLEYLLNNYNFNKCSEVLADSL